MKIALIGYGQMGRAVEEAARPRGHEVTARIGRSENVLGSGITEEGVKGAEVAIDFSEGDAVVTNVERAAALGLDVVVGTTGWNPASRRMRKAVKEGGIGLVHSPNFSVGVHLFMQLVRLAGRLADRFEDYDPHIVEAHHRHKRDRPSGTALRVAEVLLAEVRRKEQWEESAMKMGRPDPHALQVAVSRAGEHPGMHLVGLDSPDDRIEIRHEARSRMGFARGALAAAEWVRGRKGVYSMDDWLADAADAPGTGGADGGGMEGGAGAKDGEDGSGRTEER